MKFPAKTIFYKTCEYLGTAVLAATLLGCDVSPAVDGEIELDQQSDAIIADYPIAYIERPLPVDEDGEPAGLEVLEMTTFNPGARLIVKARAKASAYEEVITEGLFPGLELDPETGEEISTYDVKDLSVSADGRKLLFAMRAPEIEGLDDDQQPTWNIWEYDLDGSSEQPRRIIPTSRPIEAEKGDDIQPHYLPNGRIVFTSNRQFRTQSILVDEGKSQYQSLTDDRSSEAMVLHTIDDQGNNIEQISFNVSHDMYPSVLESGEIIFLRWDGINRNGRLSLYKANPDGSNVRHLYGFNSQDTGTDDSEGVYTRPRELPDGRIMVNLHPRETDFYGGDIVAIDVANFVANTEGTYENRGAAGPAQQSLLTDKVDSSGANPSIGGYYYSAYPYYDGTGRLLISWSQCRLLDPETDEPSYCTPELIDADAEPARPAYALWEANPNDGTRLPLLPVKSGTMLVEAVVLAPKSVLPEDIRAENVDPELVADGLGVLHVRSVYDVNGTDVSPNGIEITANPTQTDADDRPARFIRIVKNVPLPSDDVLDFDDAIFGATTAQRMKDIVGYVMVEPDGSAMFTVPADIPIMVDVLDNQGQRINARDQTWLYLKAGEVRECASCNLGNRAQPYNRSDAETPNVYSGAIGGAPFPGTQIRDEFGTAEVDPEAGETMAQYRSRLFGPRTPSVDIIFEDDWTDSEGSFPPAETFRWRYVDISTLNANPTDPACPPLDIAPPEWKLPTTEACIVAGQWSGGCRITINYLDSIHPLWEADRRNCDQSGNLISDTTCTSCHRSQDQLGDIVPAGQLELTGGPSVDQNGFITSYAELRFSDNRQHLDEGALTDLIIYTPTGEFEREEPLEGEELGALILDELGNPIEIIDESFDPLEIPLNTAGARNQNSQEHFFSLFQPGGTHYGYLSESELKLISEWIDIGGQYYNNPFDAPQ